MPIHHDPAAATGLPFATLDLLPFMRSPPPPPPTADDDDEPRRAAKLVMFPAPAPDRCRLMSDLALTVADRLEQGHVELLEAASELLALNEHAFASRLKSMLSDDAGKALLGDLIGSISGASTDFDRGSRVLFVLSARLTAGLGEAWGRGQ